MRTEWWPGEWAGETVVVVCSGPSAVLAPLDLARGRARVVTVNESWRLAPWADVAYGCDWPWWVHRGPALDQFPGLRVIGHQPSESEQQQQLDEAQREFVAGLLTLPVQPKELLDKQSLDFARGPVLGGSMSGFQVVMRLAQARVARILLVGVDCHHEPQDGPLHWHGPHSHPNGANPSRSRRKTWLHQWTRAAPQFAAHGIEVINCSRESAVECFRKQGLKAALGA